VRSFWQSSISSATCQSTPSENNSSRCARPSGSRPRTNQLPFSRVEIRDAERSAGPRRPYVPQSPRHFIIESSGSEAFPNRQSASSLRAPAYARSRDRRLESAGRSLNRTLLGSLALQFSSLTQILRKLICSPSSPCACSLIGAVSYFL
jgi:hypothetical protein